MRGRKIRSPKRNSKVPGLGKPVAVPRLNIAAAKTIFAPCRSTNFIVCSANAIPKSSSVPPTGAARNARIVAPRGSTRNFPPSHPPVPAMILTRAKKLVAGVAAAAVVADIATVVIEAQKTAAAKFTAQIVPRRFSAEAFSPSRPPGAPLRRRGFRGSGPAPCGFAASHLSSRPARTTRC